MNNLPFFNLSPIFANWDKSLNILKCNKLYFILQYITFKNVKYILKYV